MGGGAGGGRWLWDNAWSRTLVWRLIGRRTRGASAVVATVGSAAKVGRHEESIFGCEGPIVSSLLWVWSGGSGDQAVAARTSSSK